MYQAIEADKVIRRVARKFCPSFLGYKDFHDLVQEGHEEAMKLETKGELPDNFQPILYTWLRSLWLNELKGMGYQKRDWKKEVRIDDEKFNQDSLSFDPTEHIETLLSVSDELRTIALLLMNTPKELVEMVKLYNNREGVSRYLRKVLHWSDNQVEEWIDLWNSVRDEDF